MLIGDKPLSDEITVADTSSVVIQEGGFRSYFFIRNTSAGGDTIYLSFGKTAEVGKGIILYSGEYYQEENNTGFRVWQGSISAITDVGGAGTIAVMVR